MQFWTPAFGRNALSVFRVDCVGIDGGLKGGTESGNGHMQKIIIYGSVENSGIFVFWGWGCWSREETVPCGTVIVG